MFVYHSLWPLHFGWLSVCIRRIIYKFLNVSPFDNMAVAVSGVVEHS